MNEPNESVGRASLWTSVAGLVLPLSLAILAAVFIADTPEGRSRRETAYILSAFLFGILELAALVCGIIGRHTRSGKAGLMISGIILVLILVLIPILGFFWFFLGSSPAPQNPPAQPNAPAKQNQ